MEFLSVLLPFFGIGFGAAIISRFTGVALSMLLVPAVLYFGATPIEAVCFMLTFVLYNNYTIETQEVRMNFKELTFFPGWKVAIPIIVLVVGSMVVPFLSIAFFIFCFILELFAFAYKRLKEDDRPSVNEVITHSLLSAIFGSVGIFLVPFIPQEYFFLLVGIVILLISAFAWYAGNHRDAFRGTWSFIWSAMTFFLGFCGVEAANYPKGLTRSFKAKVEHMRSVIFVGAAFVGLIVSFILFNIFSVPALVAAIGAALGIRLAGVYEFSRYGSFSYLAIGFAVLSVLCLWLVAPQVTSFDYINVFFNQAIQ